ncbi:MAG: protoheme IX farnesyltransferase, partial [Phycisphaerae bacterium]
SVLSTVWAAVGAVATLVLYVGVYTPAKRVTSLCVLIGAVPGALPPVIGWAAGGGSLALHAWLLFALVFVWQLPHFATIAWLYRDDYARAGYPMLPVIDPVGIRTDLHLITHSIMLITVSTLPVVYGMAGSWYLCCAIVSGTAFLAFGIVFVVRKTPTCARMHVIASVSHLLLLCVIMVLDKTYP